MSEEQRFFYLTEKWKRSGIENLNDPQLDGLFKRIKQNQSNKRLIKTLLPLFNNRLEKLLKEKGIIELK